MLNNKLEQTGRSMVEMLGVLAVIGVLSITGISGYTTAMNKHKANQILDAASKRAVAVSTQIQRGNTNPTLDEFGNEAVKGVTYGKPVKVGENQFKIPLNWESETLQTTLCKDLKSYLSTTGTDSTSQIDDGCTRIVYNNDLSVGATLSNNTNYDSASEKCVDSYGSFCENACPSGTGTDTATYKGGQVGTTGCYCQTSGHNYDATNGCKSSCSADNFSSCDEAGCTGLNNNNPPANTTFIWITPAGGTSDDAFCAKHITSNMNWCQARTACGGQDNMVLLADLNCGTSGSCGATGISGKYFWTADCINGCPSTKVSDTSCDSGYAWNVNFNGYVYYYLRNSNYHGYALCK